MHDQRTTGGTKQVHIPAAMHYKLGCLALDKGMRLQAVVAAVMADGLKIEAKREARRVQQEG